MNSIFAMCNEGIQYPLNLSRSEYLDHVLSSYFAQLNEHQQRLFSKEGESALKFRDLDNDGDST